MMKKRGLSDVVTTVLFILIIIAAVAAIWGFLLPALRQTGTTTETATAAFTAPKLSIVPGSVSLNPIKNTINFNVKRETGQGKIVALNTIIEDAYGNTKNFTQSYPSGINELEIKPISIDYSGGNLGQAVGISVAPIVQGSEGGQVIGVNIDSRDIKVDDVFKGLVAYWKFDESSYTGTGNEVRDQTGNHDGQALYGLTTTPGKLGNAAQFNGNISQVIVSHPETFDFANDMTVLVWVNYTDKNIRSTWSQGNTILVKSHNNWWLGKEFGIGIYGGNAPGLSPIGFSRLMYSGDQSDYWHHINGAGSYENLDEKKWYHIGFSYNNATHKMILYINGRPASSFYQTSEGAVFNGIPQHAAELNFSDGVAEFWPYADTDGQVIKIGAMYDQQDPVAGAPLGSYYNYKGLMDDMMIFNRTLTNEEVAKIYDYYQ